MIIDNNTISGLQILLEKVRKGKFLNLYAEDFRLHSDYRDICKLLGQPEDSDGIKLIILDSSEIKEEPKEEPKDEV